MKHVQKILIKLIIVVLTATMELGCVYYSDQAELLTALAASRAVMKDEYKEEFKIEPIHGVFEIFGLLLIESNSWDSPAGPMSVPHFVLEVEHITRLDPATINSLKPESDKTEYERLGWDVIHESYHGVYGVGEALEAFRNHQVRIIGKVYDLCGFGWYLQDTNDSDMACNTESTADVYSAVELRNIGDADMQVLR